MNLTDVYDNQGFDGQENAAAFNKLPRVLQYFITSQQKLLTEKIRRKVEQLYGVAGLNDLVKTSGFRAVSVNARHGGVNDSLHLWGCAADFAKSGRFKQTFIPMCCDLQLIDSGDCWHVQFKRGS